MRRPAESCAKRFVQTVWGVFREQLGPTRWGLVGIQNKGIAGRWTLAILKSVSESPGRESIQDLKKLKMKWVEEDLLQYCLKYGCDLYGDVISALKGAYLLKR